MMEWNWVLIVAVASGVAVGFYVFWQWVEICKWKDRCEKAETDRDHWKGCSDLWRDECRKCEGLRHMVMKDRDHWKAECLSLQAIVEEQ